MQISDWIYKQQSKNAGSSNTILQAIEKLSNKMNFNKQLYIILLLQGTLAVPKLHQSYNNSDEH